MDGPLSNTIPVLKSKESRKLAMEKRSARLQSACGGGRTNIMFAFLLRYPPLFFRRFPGMVSREESPQVKIISFRRDGNVDR